MALFAAITGFECAATAVRAGLLSSVKRTKTTKTA
jgi:hypothetical protein